MKAIQYITPQNKNLRRDSFSHDCKLAKEKVELITKMLNLLSALTNLCHRIDS
jgi:hypothetical protein